jgi:hypothetical protein
MWIAALLAITLLGAGVVFLSPNRYAGKLATAISVLPLAGATYMYWTYLAGGDRGINALLSPGDVAFGQTIDWIQLGPYTLQYNVGLDGVSLPLLLLTTVLTTLALVSSWTPIDNRERQFYGLMLFMEANLLGGTDITDVTSGFRAYDMSLIEELERPENDHWALEQTLEIARKDNDIVEVSVPMPPETSDSQFDLGTYVRYPARMLFTTLKVVLFR